MVEQRENDDGVTPLVRAFRRIARLAAADPLRLLAADPMVLMNALGAPVEALIGIAPFERLRSAVATPAADTRRDSTPARVQPLPLPLARTSAATRPGAIQALGQTVSRAIAPARDAGLRLARSDTNARRSSDAAESLERRSSRPATLAQRRATLRRTLNANAALQVSPAASAAFASSASSAQGTPPPAANAVAGMIATGVGSALRAALLGFAPRASSGTDLAASVGPGAQAAGTSAAAGAVTVVAQGVVDAAVAAVSASGMAPELATAQTRQATTSSASGAATSRNSPVPGQATSTPSLDSRAGTQGFAAASQSQGHPPAVSGFDFADDLFEALYRSGVDLSWP